MDLLAFLMGSQNQLQLQDKAIAWEFMMLMKQPTTLYGYRPRVEVDGGVYLLSPSVAIKSIVTTSSAPHKRIDTLNAEEDFGPAKSCVRGSVAKAVCHNVHSWTSKKTMTKLIDSLNQLHMKTF